MTPGNVGSGDVGSEVGQPVRWVVQRRGEGCGSRSGWRCQHAEHMPSPAWRRNRPHELQIRGAADSWPARVRTRPTPAGGLADEARLAAARTRRLRRLPGDPAAAATAMRRTDEPQRAAAVHAPVRAQPAAARARLKDPVLAAARARRFRLGLADAAHAPAAMPASPASHRTPAAHAATDRDPHGAVTSVAGTGHGPRPPERSRGRVAPAAAGSPRPAWCPHRTDR
jgi:hypothetical protein